MEKRGARLFQAEVEYGWNIVELESRRQLRQKVNELIRLVNDPTITTSEMRQHVLHGVATYGNLFATQLVRSLLRDDPQERQSLVWLLTLLNDPETAPMLRFMAHNTRLPRAIRLSASLALAGMGATEEMTGTGKRAREHQYAIG